MRNIFSSFIGSINMFFSHLLLSMTGCNICFLHNNDHRSAFHSASQAPDTLPLTDVDFLGAYPFVSIFSVYFSASPAMYHSFFAAKFQHFHHCYLYEGNHLRGEAVKLVKPSRLLHQKKPFQQVFWQTFQLYASVGSQMKADQKDF